MPEPAARHQPHRTPAAPTVRDRLKPLQRPPGEALRWVQLRNVNFHPSIFKKMIGTFEAAAKNGDLVSVYDRDGQMFGTGLLSLKSPIGLLMLTFDTSPFDEAQLEARIKNAMMLRREALRLDASANAYRLIHAEGDGLPGLIADRFDEFAVVELFSFPMFRRMEMIRRVLTSFEPIREVIFRADERVQLSEGFTLGESAPEGPTPLRSADRRSTQIT